MYQLSSRRTVRSFMLCFVFLVGCNISLESCNQVGGQNTCAYGPGGSTPSGGPTQGPISGGQRIHQWHTQAVQGDMSVQGPGVISGDLDVNGVTVHQGLGDEGTVI